MDDAPPQPGPETNLSTSDPPQTASELPPEAIALATRFFDGARNGQMDIFEQALPRGLPANLTNEKGDTLVSPLRQTRWRKCHGSYDSHLIPHPEKPSNAITSTFDPDRS